MLSSKRMVEGFPQVDEIEVVYKGCNLGKQHRLFPYTITMGKHVGIYALI